jgi:hypothetical protein
MRADFVRKRSVRGGGWEEQGCSKQEKIPQLVAAGFFFGFG